MEKNDVGEFLVKRFAAAQREVDGLVSKEVLEDYRARVLSAVREAVSKGAKPALLRVRFDMRFERGGLGVEPVADDVEARDAWREIFGVPPILR